MPKKPRRKHIRVEYKRLIKQWGLSSYEDKLIELDVKLKGKKHLEILIHEALHILHPKWVEEVVEEYSIILTNLIWEQGYRRVDDDTSIPLQDGKK